MNILLTLFLVILYIIGYGYTLNKILSSTKASNNKNLVIIFWPIIVIISLLYPIFLIINIIQWIFDKKTFLINESSKGPKND